MRCVSSPSSTAIRHITNAQQLGTMENAGAAPRRMRLATMWLEGGGTARKNVQHAWQEKKINPASFLLPIGMVTPTPHVLERPAMEMVLVLIPGAFLLPLLVVNMQSFVRMMTVQVYNIYNSININMIELQTKIIIHFLCSTFCSWLSHQQRFPLHLPFSVQWFRVQPVHWSRE